MLNEASIQSQLNSWNLLALDVAVGQSSHHKGHPEVIFLEDFHIV